MTTLLPAAVQTDQIQHSNALTGLLVGVGVGLAIGVFTVCTAGAGGIVAAAIIGGAVAGGAGIGETIGSLSPAGGKKTGKIVSGSPDVLIYSLGAARASGDQVDCDGPPPFGIPHHGAKWLAQGAATVFVNDLPAARVSEMTQCSAQIVLESCRTVLIGGPTVQTMELESEVPEVIHNIILVTGLAAGIVLVGPVVTAFSFVGGYYGGQAGAYIGYYASGGNQDWAKIGGLVGSFAGGYAGARVGMGTVTYLQNGPLLGTGLSRGPFGAFLKSGVRGVQAFNRAQAFMNTLDRSQFQVPSGRQGALWFRDGMETANGRGYVTMNETVGGQRILNFFADGDGLGSNQSMLPWDAQRLIWAEGSTMFAENLAANSLASAGSGPPPPVPVFGTGSPSPYSIFTNYEQPVLNNAGVPVQFFPGGP